jgi:hypothetical protein
MDLLDAASRPVCQLSAAPKHDRRLSCSRSTSEIAQRGHFLGKTRSSRSISSGSQFSIIICLEKSDIGPRCIHE